MLTSRLFFKVDGGAELGIQRRLQRAHDLLHVPLLLGQRLQLLLHLQA